jgi:membrane fusion protein, multidrug efflux system
MENNNGIPENGKKIGIKKFIPLVIIIIVVVTIGIVWYRNYSKYISSDDAYIDSENVSVSSKIMGRVNHLYVDEGDSVNNGMLLAELDSSDLLAQKKQAIATMEQAIANTVQSGAKYNYDKENIKVVEVNYYKALEDFTRSTKQFDGDVITKEQYDHSQKTLESAKAQLEAAKSQLDVSKAQIGSSNAVVNNASAQIGVIATQINNTRLYSPIKGVVARRWLLPGDIAQPGQSIFTLNNNFKLWVTVFLEETNLSQVHVNQKAIFTVDAFPGIEFFGKIISIGSNTASQFSLIPPNNASGNFTKITQRVPVKISINGTNVSDGHSDYKLLSGMSVVVKILKD